MNHLIKRAIAAFILAIYSTGIANAGVAMRYHNVDSCDYTTSPAIIEQKKQSMLAVDDNENT